MIERFDGEKPQEIPMVFGDRVTLSGFDQDTRSYATNQWEQRPDRGLNPLVDIHQVLDTQSLVMRLSDQHGRSLLRGERRHGFAALNAIHTNQDKLYDGSIEEYLVTRVAKESYDQWSMRIRFRQNELSEVRNKISYFDDYSFSWLKNGNLQAWYGNYALASTELGVYQEWRKTEPIDPEMLEDLHKRLEDHMTMVVATDALKNVRQQLANTQPEN